MFKAKLIEDSTYYKLRRKQLILALVPLLPFGILVNFYDVPLLVSVVMLFVYVLAIVLGWRNLRSMRSLVGSHSIELEPSELRVISRTGEVQRVIDLNDVELVTVKSTYGMPQDSTSEIVREVKGKPRQNFLVLRMNGKDQRFDFELDSYYMITQLNKLVEHWESSGLRVAKVA